MKYKDQLGKSDNPSGLDQVERLFAECIQQSSDPIVEIGVRTGGTTVRFIDILGRESKKNILISIDPYIGSKEYTHGNQSISPTTHYDDDMHNEVIPYLTQYAQDKGIDWRFHRQTSQEYIDMIRNDPFWNKRQYSFVYLDGDHSLSVVMMELAYFIDKAHMVIVDDTKHIHDKIAAYVSVYDNVSVSKLNNKTLIRRQLNERE
jgi:hypothetical protein